MRSLYQISKRSFTNQTHNILVLNAGSSSLKYKLFSVENESLLPCCHGKFEQISNLNQQLEYQYTHYLSYETSNVASTKYTGSTTDRMDYIKSMNILFEDLLNISNPSLLSLTIGHRIVHGGDTYSHPQLIDANVMNIIDKYSQIAPLHNPYQLECIQAVNAQTNLNTNSQFAVFDTAFHSQMPMYAYKYAINKDITSQYQNNHNIEVRRYGFHGISYEYILDKASKYFKRNKNDINLIAIHLGSGCSACCIENGISIDTSMGFTPLEGLIMGTRCGDIDSGLLLELMNESNINKESITNILNKQSGLKGICGTNDMRQILYSENSEKNNEYELALDMFAYRIKKYIGSYYALLNGNVDGLVFTGGIGENIPYKLLIKIIDGLNNLGFTINNTPTHKDKDVKLWNDSRDGNSIPVLSIMTDEELAIAQQIMNQLSCVPLHVADKL